VVVVAIVLLLGLLADSYAMYRVHVQRLGNALDFYPIWAGSREVVLNRHNPYDPDVMREIQVAIYGRPALPEENQHGYAYPAYTSLVLLPFLLLPFPVAASLWIAVQQLLLVAAVILVVQATDWRTGPWRLALLSLVAMTFRYSMITFVLGQTAIWVLFCLALALWAARRQRYTLAGLALTAGAIKPQLVVLPALALLASLRPRPRQRALLTAGGTLILLLGGSFLLAGNWTGDYWQQIQSYSGYSTTQFPLQALAEIWLAPPISQAINTMAVAALLGVLAWVLWQWRGSGQIALPVALAVVVTQLVVPQTGSYNLVLLLLPAIVALQRLSTGRSRRQPLTIAGRVLVWADLLVIPWLLWPVIQYEGGTPLDLVVVPALLLLVIFALVATDKAHRPDLALASEKGVSNRWSG
jgi:hypothetical protein